MLNMDFVFFFLFFIEFVQVYVLMWENFRYDKNKLSTIDHKNVVQLSVL